MKKIMILLIIMLSGSLMAQKKVLGYLTDNGTNYAPGDTVQLGTPSNVTLGQFSFIQKSVMMQAMLTGVKNSYLLSRFAHSFMLVKKIKVVKSRRTGNKTYLIGGVGGIGNYWIDIESALETGEAIDPNAAKIKEHSQQFSLADELRKLKNLLDETVITQVEYTLLKSNLIEQ